MDDSGCVGGYQSRTGLVCDVQNLRQGEPASIYQALLQGHAFKELHENVGGTVGSPASVEHLDDVRMAYGTRSTSFVEKPADQLGVLCQCRMQYLHGGATLDQLVLDQIDFPKAALADQPDHTVVSEELPRL